MKTTALTRLALAAAAGALLSAQSASAQWVACTNSSSVTCTSQNVGVGTTAPAATLDVGGSIRSKAMTVSTTSTTDPLLFLQVAGISNILSITGSAATGYVPLDLRDGIGTSHIYLPNYTGDAYLNNIGNVGVGTTTPQAKLDVSGAVRTKALTISSTSTSDTLMTVQVAGVSNILAVTPSVAQAYVPLDLRDGAGTSRIYLPNYTGNAYFNNVGNVGVGTTNPQYKLDVAGAIRATQVIGAVYQDVAEWVPATETMSPGTVVVVQRGSKNTVGPSHAAYQTSVAGVVSEQPGVILGEAGAAKAMVATTGRVKVHVDATRGAIEAGDLLVTSNKPGTAMKSQPVEVGGLQLHRPGTLIGKALESLPNGEGDILVLLSLQ